MSDAQPTLLVAGGAGFIGGHFIRSELTRNVRVVNLDKLTYAAIPEVLPPHPELHSVQGCIRDMALARELLEQRQPTAVINFAAESHVDRSIDEPGAFVLSNIVGVHTLLEAVKDYWSRLGAERRRAFRFVQISTDEVFGPAGPEDMFDEQSPYRPSSPYSATKAAADHLVRSYHVTYGLPTLVTYGANNYGPNQHPEKMMPLMILNAVEGSELPVYGDGLHERDWLHVADHCDAISRCWRYGEPGASYAIGSGVTRTNIDVVTRICELVDAMCEPIGRCRKELIRAAADRPGHDRRYALDASRIRDELDWRPQVDFEHGLRSTIRWYLDHPDWRRERSERRRQGSVTQPEANP